jgi:autotransporter-associated beta strand protein
VTINVADITSRLNGSYSNVTILTACYTCTQDGVVTIGTAINADANLGSTAYNKLLKIQSNSDINVNYQISLANSGGYNNFYNTHALELNSTNGGINLIAAVRTQPTSADNYAGTGYYSGSITLSALNGTISSTSAGTINASGYNAGNTSYSQYGGAINISARNINIGSTVSSTSNKGDATYGGDITITTTNTSVDGSNVGVSGVISGKNFTKSGVGILKLSGVNTYAGTTTLGAGTMQLGSGTNIPDASAVSLSSSSSVLDMNGKSETIGSLASANALSVVSSSGSGNYTLTTGGNNGTTSYAGLLQDNILSGSGVMNYRVQILTVV